MLQTIQLKLCTDSRFLLHLTREKANRRLKGQKTMFVIAHRLSTVKHCDRIYRLEQGQIIEEGTPEQVLQQAS